MAYQLLLVDDSATIHKAVQISFACEDFNVAAVTNADEAIAQAQQVKVDAALVDVHLAGVDGYSVCQTLKSDPALANVPILLLGNNADPVDDSRVQACGATGHILKPFDTQSLIDRVKKLVGAPITASGPQPLSATMRAASPAAAKPAPAIAAAPAPTVTPSPMHKPVVAPAATPPGFPSSPVTMPAPVLTPAATSSPFASSPLSPPPISTETSLPNFAAPASTPSPTPSFAPVAAPKIAPIPTSPVAPKPMAAPMVTPFGPPSGLSQKFPSQPPAIPSTGTTKPFAPANFSQLPPTNPSAVSSGTFNPPATPPRPPVIPSSTGFAPPPPPRTTIAPATPVQTSPAPAWSPTSTGASPFNSNVATTLQSPPAFTGTNAPVGGFGPQTSVPSVTAEKTPAALSSLEASLSIEADAQLAAPAITTPKPAAAPFVNTAAAAAIPPAPIDTAVPTPQLTSLPVKTTEATALTAAVEPAIEKTEENTKVSANAAALAGIDENMVKALAREIIERIAWEIVPELTEAIIREHLEKQENKQQ